VFVAFFVAVTQVRVAVVASLPKLRRAGGRTAVDHRPTAASAEMPHGELEMLDLG